MEVDWFALFLMVLAVCWAVVRVAEERYASKRGDH